MTQYAVLHVSKGKGSGGGLQKHIDRETTPDNADIAKSHLNQIDDYSHLGKTLGERADAVISRAGVTRKVRPDAVKYCPILLSGSHERMKEIEAEGGLERWAEDCKEFVESKWGKENIISFALHRDEKTPHIHCVVVPIKEGENKKGEKVKKLTAREMFDRKALTNLQDIFAMYVSEYGFERGKEGSRAKHTTVQQFYKTLPERIEGMQKDIEGKAKELEELKALQEQYSAAGNAKKLLKGATDLFTKSGKKKDEEIQGLQAQIAQSTDKYSKLEGRLSKIVDQYNELGEQFTVKSKEVQELHTKVNHLEKMNQKIRKNMLDAVNSKLKENNIAQRFSIKEQLNLNGKITRSLDFKEPEIIKEKDRSRNKGLSL